MEKPMMDNKNLWIKKYSYVKGLGYLYLVADFKRMEKGPRLIVHEIVVDYMSLDDHGYNHRAYEYDLEVQLSVETPLERIVQSVFERHRSAITAEVESGDAADERYLPFEEIDSGIKALYDLQFTEIFLDLKVQILKEPRSDRFSTLLNNMAHLPLRVEQREKAVTGTKLTSLAGG